MWKRLTEKLTALWTDGRRIERVGYTVAILAFTSGLFHLIVYAIDGGPWTGPVSWRKPVTFGLSFGIVLATIVWVSTYLTIGSRARTVLLSAFTAASAVEVVGITVQQWRGVPSHFNIADPLSAIIARAGLAAGGGVLVAVVVILAVVSLRAAPHTSPSMLLAVRAGLLILVGAMASGAVMIATGTILGQTEGLSQAYLNAGWLKPTHAVTMHAVTVLPALALLTSCLNRDESWRLRVSRLGVAAYAVATVVTIGANLVLG